MTYTLDQKYTLGNRLKGSNALAYAAALNVIREPARYNPLFFYGKTSIERIHLLQAIASEFERVHKRSALYLTVEDFISKFVFAIRHHQKEQFRHWYRSYPLLIIDGLQIIAGKKYSEEELIMTIKEFEVKGYQIILLSDYHPADIIALHNELRDYCYGGLMFEFGREKPLV